MGSAVLIDLTSGLFWGIVLVPTLAIDSTVVIFTVTFISSRFLDTSAAVKTRSGKAITPFCEKKNHHKFQSGNMDSGMKKDNVSN